MYLRRHLFTFFLPAMIPLVFIACKPTVFTPVFEAKTIDDKVAIGYGLAIGDVEAKGSPRRPYAALDTRRALS